MTMIRLSKEERRVLIEAVRDYCRDELDVELGEFDGGFLLDFFTERVGPLYYNRGVADAQRFLAQRVSDLSDELDGLIRATPFDR